MYRIGILGASWIASKAVIEPASQVKQAVVHGIATREKNRAFQFSAEHNISEVFEDYTALIESDNIDVVYVGLPPSHHARWAIAALQAGKNVICEKPIAMNSAEANAMLAAASESHGRLIEAFHTAFHPSFVACKAWVKSGAIGQVKSMKAHFNIPLEDDGFRNQYRPESGGGSFMDMGCYPLQWVDAMAGGDVSEISAKADLTSSGVDGRMVANLRFDNGVIAKISCSMLGPEPLSSALSIIGSEGKIEFTNPLVPHDGGKLVLTTNDGTVDNFDVSGLSTYQYQMQTILDSFDSGIEVVTEGLPIVRQQALIDRIYSAAGLEHLRTIQPKS